MGFDTRSSGWFPILAWICLGLMLAMSFSCGSSGGNGVVTPPASFISSGTAASPDQVRLIGQGVSSNRVRVNVVIHGQTTSSDLYSLAFDLLLSNATGIEYVAGSATAGDALTPGAGQGMSVMVSQQGDRVVVGVSKTGGGNGNQVSAGDHVVVTMDFRVPSTGTTTLQFAGSPSNPQNPTTDPAALNSNGVVIATLTFDQALAMISR